MIEEWKDNERQKSGDGEPKNNRPGKSFPDRISDDGERTQDGCERCEQNRKQPDATRFHQSLGQWKLAFFEFIEIGQVDDSIFHHDPGESNHADHGGCIEIRSLGCSEDSKSDQYPNERQGNSRHDE